MERRHEMLLALGAMATAAVVCVLILVVGAPGWSIAGLLGAGAGVAAGTLAAHVVGRSVHLEARRSHKILKIADESVSHLRQGG